jgi:predicted dehydrogenase
MKPVTIGILGVADHFRLRVRVPVANLDTVRIEAIASRSLERAKAAAAEWQIDRAYGSYDELLADDGIEAVYIPLPNTMHVEWIKKCADAGKHVLCEKPLAGDYASAQDAVAYAESRGVLLMEGFMYRFHPQWLRTRELVQIGEIGEPRAIHTIFTYDNQDPANIRNRPEAGGGAILDIGCYAVSSARFLLGREPLRVVSMMERHPTFGTDVLVSAILDFGSARALFTVSTSTWFQEQVRVFGSGGTLTMNSPFNVFPDVPIVVGVENTVGTREVSFAPVDHFAEMFDAFAKAVRTDGLVPTPPADALANMKVLDALFRSAETGTWENV